MTLHVICAAYKRVIPLRILIDSFIVQTNPNWKLYVIHDGEMPAEVSNISSHYTDDPRVTFHQSVQRNGNSGFVNRDAMMKSIMGDSSDFVLGTNDDNYYVPTFVDEILRECRPGVGMVYCDMVLSGIGYQLLPTILKVYHVDMGAFVVNLPLAQRVGINNLTGIADGLFAEDCVRECKILGLMTTKIAKILFVHN
jgi:hypothetical protein